MRLHEECASDMTAGWSATELAQVTGGRWLIAPRESDWRSLGICAEPSQFRKGQMLLAPAGLVGLRPAAIERLAPRASGIVAQAGEANAYGDQSLLEVADLRDAVAALGTDARNPSKERSLP
ncbi:hypothetical protein OKW45_003422 [Paraburkholderia sp. WSM4175]